MSNSYLLFSERIDDLTKEEKAWIDDLPSDCHYDDDEGPGTRDDWEQKFNAALIAYGLDTSGIADTLGTFPDFACKTREGYWWLYAEESADIAHVACVVQAFIKKFRPDYVFKLTWCGYCDKPRIGEFGGGWLVVGADKAIWGNTWERADEITEALQTGNSEP